MPRRSTGISTHDRSSGAELPWSRAGRVDPAAGFGMEWELHDTAVQPRVLILVSKAVIFK